MTLDGAIAQQRAKVGEFGKAILNVQYPNEFELYLMGLELTDQNFNTIRYFVFPVMPSSIDENLPQLNNIKKTMAGVTVLSSPTFNPTDINLNGTFGRRFRVLLGTDASDLVSSFKADGKLTAKSILGGAASFFDNRIKTGYGCIKILQDIIDQSQQVDEKGIRHLILYNPALGNNYLVKPINLRFNQSQDSNMIWNYNLQLKSIAPLESIKTQQQLKQARFRLNSTGYAQKQAQNVVNALSMVLGTGITIVDNKVKSRVEEVKQNIKLKLKNKKPNPSKNVVNKWIKRH